MQAIEERLDRARRIEAETKGAWTKEWTEARHRVAASPRYRLDVMLPFQITRTGQVRIGLRSEGKRNADLEEDHFVIVARPWGELESGLRTFIIDETGQVYVSEGVSDKEALRTRALPELHPSIAGVIVTGGMRLYPIDNLPKR